MGVDYYNLLAINADASNIEIHKAYRRLALRYHPLRNESRTEASEKFKWISEAYEVLIDPVLRARYDQYGEEGLKHGVPHMICNPQKYTYHGDPYMTFQNYFGGENPFREFSEEMDLEFYVNFGRKGGRGELKKGDTIEKILELTLEEIYNGCVKKIPITHRVFDKDCNTTVLEEKILSIVVCAGWRENTRITFANEGDQGPNIIPGDIVFILKSKKHDRFWREGINLHHTVKVPVGQAILGTSLDIHTLDGRKIHVPITQIISPEYVKIVESEGMPDSCSHGKKGDLHIHFDIQFPERLSQNQRLGTEAALYRNGNILTL